MTTSAPYRQAPPRPTRTVRIEHRWWWHESTFDRRWVPFQTYAWASHGCWTYPTEPWVIVEHRPAADSSDSHSSNP